MSCLPVGTKVRWTSQAGASRTTKEGVVVYSVDKAKASDEVQGVKSVPHLIADRLFSTHRRMFDGNSWLSRQGVLVEVRDGKTSRAKPKLYMPNPGSLEVIE